jgi:hypothetical protein
MKNFTTASIIFLGIIFLQLFSANGQTNNIDQLFGNSHFTFEEIDQEIIVVIEKQPWEGFTLSLDDQDFFKNPVCNLQVKSYEDLILKIELSDGERIYKDNSAMSYQIIGDDKYHDVVFDFSSAVSNFKVTSKPYLIFYVNPGKTHTGELMIKNIQFSSPENEIISVQVETDPELLVYPNPATDNLNITIPPNFSGNIIICDIVGREILRSPVQTSNINSAKIDISSLNTGIYLINLKGRNTSVSHHFQVN